MTKVPHRSPRGWKGRSVRSGEPRLRDRAEWLPTRRALDALDEALRRFEHARDPRARGFRLRALEYECSRGRRRWVEHDVVRRTVRGKLPEHEHLPLRIEAHHPPHGGPRSTTDLLPDLEVVIRRRRGVDPRHL